MSDDYGDATVTGLQPHAEMRHPKASRIALRSRRPEWATDFYGSYVLQVSAMRRTLSWLMLLSLSRTVVPALYPYPYHTDEARPAAGATGASPSVITISAAGIGRASEMELREHR